MNISCEVYPARIRENGIPVFWSYFHSLVRYIELMKRQLSKCLQLSPPPFRLQTHRSRWPLHRSEGCERFVGQLIRASVFLMIRSSPQASAVAGIDVGHEETEWTPQNANGRFDMDTFDLTSAPTIIERCISEPKKTNWYHQLKVLVSIRTSIPTVNSVIGLMRE